LKEFRGNASRDRVAAVRLPTRDEVESLLELREQARNLGGIVLEIAIDRHDDIALRLSEAGGECRSLAKVPSQAHDANV